MTQITGLEQIDDLNVSVYVKDGNVTNASLLANLDSSSVQRLEYYSFLENNCFDLSKFTNIKVFTGSLEDIVNIPSNIEELNLHIGFGKFIISNKNNQPQLKTEEQKVIDLRHLTELKRISMKTFSSSYEKIMFPDSVEEINMQDFFQKLTEIDLRNCHKLKKIKFMIIAPELQNVYLPDSLQDISAKYCDSGIGICSAGFEKSKLKFEIPNTANPEIISYLRKEWGDNRVSVVAEPKKSVNNYLLLQKTNNRLK